MCNGGAEMEEIDVLLMSRIQQREADGSVRSAVLRGRGRNG